MIVPKMYERVKLVKPIYLDFTGAVMGPGTEATIVDLLDDDVVLIEFDLDEQGVNGGPRVVETVATVFDFIPIQ
jgi:hypothetical protein